MIDSTRGPKATRFKLVGRNSGDKRTKVAKSANDFGPAAGGLRAIAERTPVDRHEWVRLTRRFIEDEKEKLKQAHWHGASGLEIVRLWTSLIDDVIKGAFDLVVLKNGSRAAIRCAVVALGGYGRGELNPYSDIDLLFLYRGKANKEIGAIAEKMLYLLWDLNFKVGHSFRSIAECLDLACGDLTVETSLLEARHLTGDDDIFLSFKKAFREQIIEAKADDFIQRKVAEREKRRRLFGLSPTFREPDVKESPGGLRDFHLAMWVSGAKFGITSPCELLKKNIVDIDNYKMSTDGFDFLHRVRNELHFLSKRKNDRLSLELQKEAGLNLGYKDSDSFSVLQLFMKDYYRSAVAIDNFANLVVASCKEAQPVSLRAGRSKVNGVKMAKNAMNQLPFCLGIEVPEVALASIKMLPHAKGPMGIFIKEQIRSYLSRNEMEIASSVAAKKAFLELISEAGSDKSLRAMHETGLLRALIPEFSTVTFLVHRDLYHTYTVEEHLLKSVEFFEKLLRGDCSPEEQVLSKISRELRDSLVVRLSLLLHDIGKGFGPGHTAKSSDIAARICERIGLSEPQIRAVRFLVHNHLLMNRISQRRDLDDKKVIVKFALAVKNPELLKLLYIITYCDLNAVGPRVWTLWKHQLLDKLYGKTLRHLIEREGAQGEDRSLIEAARQEVLLKSWPRPEPSEVDDFFRSMPGHYLSSTPASRIIVHLKMTKELSGKKLAMRYYHNHDAGYTELIVLTDGKRGIFSNIAGVLTSKNINILSAQIFTREDGLAIDTLQMESIDKRPVADDSLWAQVEKDLNSIIDGHTSAEKLLARRPMVMASERGRHPSVHPKVKIDNSVSDTHTVIEVTCEDRLGLLYLITKSLYDDGLDVYLAKVSTEANQAVDVFYVTYLDGAKVTERRLLRQIKNNLSHRLASARGA